MATLYIHIFLAVLFTRALPDVQAAGLFAGRVPGLRTKIVFPDFENRDPKLSFARYIDNIKSKPELAGIEGFSTLSPRLSEVEALPTLADSSAQNPRLLFLGNKFSHIQSAGTGEIFSRFKNEGAEVFVVPPLSDVALSEAQKSDYRHLVAQQFDSMIALGGKAIHSDLSQRPGAYPKPTFLERDVSELGLITEYQNVENGAFFAFCRGHQLSAIANGMSLFDIRETNASLVKHRRSIHYLYLVDDGNSLLRRMLGDMGRRLVNSTHRHAVNFREDRDWRVVGVDDRKVHRPIVEVLERDNWLGLTTQFHPEKLNTPLGNQMVSGIVRHARHVREARRRFGCLTDFRALLTSGRLSNR